MIKSKLIVVIIKSAGFASYCELVPMSYLVLSCLGRNSSPIKARGAYNGALLLVGAGSRERPTLSNVVSVPVSGLTVCRSFLGWRSSSRT